MSIHIVHHIGGVSAASLHTAGEQHSCRGRDPNSCGSLAGLGRAQLRLVVPVATSAPWQVVESTRYLEQTTGVIMPESRVRVPPFPPTLFKDLHITLPTLERFSREFPPAGTSRPLRPTARAPARAPGRLNCSPAARSAASASTRRPSRSASTSLPRTKSPKATRSAIRSISSRPPPRHDREHRATHGAQVFTIPVAFTFPWNPCSPSRGNPVHDRVEYAMMSSAI